MSLHNQRFMIVCDIDGTQLDEAIHHSRYSNSDLEKIFSLRERLENLKKQGAVIVHATNRMFHLYEETSHLLATPNYLGCSASTCVYKKTEDGIFIPSDKYTDMLAASGFSRDLCVQHGLEFSDALVLSGAEHQTDTKISFLFKENVSLEEKNAIFRALQSRSKDGTSVSMVEDRDTHIIDFLPSMANKGSVVHHIAQIEGIHPDNIYVFGNANNDMSMFKHYLNCCAVGNASNSLKNHVKSLREDFNDKKEKYIIAPTHNALGVLHGLQHFGLI